MPLSGLHAMGWAVALAVAALPAKAEDVMAIGAVQVAGKEVGLIVSYADDAAILMLAVESPGGAPGYIPLFASTYRGIPAVTVDIVASTPGDAVWVQSSWPDAPILGYYQLGEAAALTSFGDMALLTSPLPQSLSGGAVAFPPVDPQTARKLASFYLQ